MKKTMLLALISLICVASLVGCGGSTGGSSVDNSAAITATINNFNAAYNAEDYNTCLNYATGWTENTKSSIISTIQMARTFSGTITIDSITDISVSGSDATASVTSTLQNADTDGVYTHTKTEIFKNDGGWKYLIY